MPGSGILESLGIYGCQAFEDALLAGLALGEPILLIGAPGSAKTTLAERLAEALRMRFWAYDASKAMFEDVVGFPDPRALHDGRVGYLQTPLSLWDKEFVLVDELSRATIGMQNKWLEVIRSRRVMGLALPDVRVVMAAMNPAGLLGTSPLDEALAGRFTFLLDVPEVHQMNAGDRRRVLENRTSADAVALGPRESGPLPDLAGLLDRIRAALPWAEGTVGSAASTYTDQVGAFFESRETFLDGRRLGMIRRALVALTAVHRIQGRLPSRPRGAPADLFRHGLETTLPFRALGRPIGRLIVDGAHHHAISSLSGAARRPLAPVNLLAAVRSLLASPGTWDDPDTVSLLVTRVSAAVEHPTRVEAAAQAGAALVLLAGRPDLLARARPEARHRLLSSWRETASLGPEQATEFASKAVDRGFESRMPEAVLAGSQRIAFRLAARLDRLPSINCNYEDFGPKLLALVEEGVSP